MHGGEVDQAAVVSGGERAVVIARIIQACLFDEFGLALESRDASEHDSNAQVRYRVLAVVMDRFYVLHFISNVIRAAAAAQPMGGPW